MTLSQEARYLRARTLAFYAWQQSQPQLVIPFLCDALDSGEASRADATAAACLSSSAPLTPIPPFTRRGRGALEVRLGK